MTSAYTKTAISLQSGLFHRAEAYAADHKLSRSELFARALAEYLERHEEASLLAQMTAVYADEDSSLPQWLTEAGDEALTQAYEWEELEANNETR